MKNSTPKPSNFENTSSNRLEFLADKPVRTIALDDVFRNHNAVILLINPANGKIIDANIAAERFYGYPLEELCTMNMSEINSLSKFDVELEMIKAHTEKKNCIASIHQTAKGVLRNVEVHSSPIVINEVKLLMSIVFDVTNRFDMEILKEKSNQKYLTLYNQNISSIMILEPIYQKNGTLIDFTCIDINETFEAFSPLKRTDLINKTVSEIAPNDAKFWLHKIKYVIHKRESLTLEDVNFDNIFFDVKITILEADRIAIFFYETTEKVLKSRKLKQSEMQLKQIFEKSHAAFFLVNSKLEIKKINGAAKAYIHTLPKSRKSLRIGNGLCCTGSFNTENKCGEGNQCKTCEFKRLIANTLYSKKEYTDIEINFERYSHDLLEKFIFLFSTAHLNINNETHVLVTLEDITKTKKLETNLELANSKVNESEKLKSAFLNNLSHELRTPLNSILGFSHLIRRGNVTHEESEQYLELISNSGDRLLQEINNIIDLAKINTNSTVLAPREFNVIELFEHIIDNMSEKHSSQKNSINLSHRGNNVIINDKYILENIISHLIDNAYKFTYNGTISVKIFVGINKISFLVADNGKGITDTEQKNLFIPFSQIGSSMMRTYDGLGIGLSISKGYTELLNGTIQLKSKENIGTIMRVEIPSQH